MLCINDSIDTKDERKFLRLFCYYKGLELLKQYYFECTLGLAVNLHIIKLPRNHYKKYMLQTHTN